MSFYPGLTSIHKNVDKQEKITSKMNTPVRSHPIDITVPDAPKKSSAPLYRSDSVDVKEFLAAISNYHPADAIITLDNGDTEDTASSRTDASLAHKIVKSLMKCFYA